MVQVLIYVICRCKNYFIKVICHFKLVNIDSLINSLLFFCINRIRIFTSGNLIYLYQASAYGNTVRKLIPNSIFNGLYPFGFGHSVKYIFRHHNNGLIVRCIFYTVTNFSPYILHKFRTLHVVRRRVHGVHKHI